MISIQFKNITRSELPGINKVNALHLNDFRATGEKLTWDIDAMWRYENWITNLPIAGYSLTNEDVMVKNEYQIVVPKGEQSHESLAARYMEQEMRNDISKIIAYVPHPDIDILGQKMNIPVSFSYPEYLLFNNKIAQKELLENMTPSWKRIEKGDLWNEEYPVIKRADGSGGYGVFIKGIQSQDDLTSAYTEFPDSEWFAESFVQGVPMSVQIYKNGDEYIVFGFSEQILENERNFIGARMKMNATIIGVYPWLEEKITESVTRLDPLFHSYSGFMGLDFMLQSESQSISILEANVRITSVSIGMLYCNERNVEGVLYEGYEKEVGSTDIVLAQSEGESDVIVF